MTTTPLTRHEEHIVDDLVGLIDYASRVLIAATAGSHYQLDKAHGLREYTDKLIKHLETATIDVRRSELVAAAVAREASRYTLGQILIDAGQLGGTA